MRKHVTTIAILLTIIIGLFPETFKDIGDFLMKYKIEVLLIFIIATLGYICYQCSAIKEQTKDNKGEYSKTFEGEPPKK